MKLFLLFLVLVCISMSAEPVWIPLDSKTPQNMEIKILNPKSAQLNIEIIVHGYFQETISINNQNYLSIFIPGCSPILKKGLPELPQFGKLFQISKKYDVTFDITSQSIKKINLPCPIAPSKGALERSEDPNDVEYEFHQDYYKNRFYPTEEQITLGKPFIFHEASGIRLNVYPVAVNNATKEMRIMTKASLTLNTARTALKLNKVSKALKRLYKSSFENFDGREASVQACSRSTSKSNKNLVVVVPTIFQDDITKWVTWKKKCGYNVTILKTTPEDTAHTIKASLLELYNNENTRFNYVVLIGDTDDNYDKTTSQPMPTFQGNHSQHATSDRVYVRLTGDDYYPDACISRISDTTSEGIQRQLDKIMHYEQSPAGEWTYKGVLIAGHEKNSWQLYDWERADCLLQGTSEETRTLLSQKAKEQQVYVINNGLQNAGYNSFQTIYYNTPDTNSQQVFDTINEGCGIICYIGHGDSDKWMFNNYKQDNNYHPQIQFTNKQVLNLNNIDKTPVIFAAACTTGNFANTPECFAEAWLRNPNGGAVAIEASSTTESWIPPCDKQATTINEIIKGELYTFGELEYKGVIDCLTKWEDHANSQGNKLAEQVNLFGDCTMIVKTGHHYELKKDIIPSDIKYTFLLTNKNNEAIDATVTIYNKTMSFISSSETNDYGKAEVSLYNAPKNEKLYYTIVGNGIDAQIDIELK